MTRPTFRIVDLAINGANGSSGFKNEWSNYNTVDGASVTQPEFIPVRDPSTGQSGQRLPSTARTMPVIFATPINDLAVDPSDVTWNTRDFDAAVRFDIVIADEMDGRSGEGELDAVLQVLEAIREDNKTPTGGVFNSEYQVMRNLNIDWNPNRYSPRWEVYYELGFNAESVV